MRKTGPVSARLTEAPGLPGQYFYSVYMRNSSRQTGTEIDHMVLFMVN